MRTITEKKIRHDSFYSFLTSTRRPSCGRIHRTTTTHNMHGFKVASAGSMRCKEDEILGDVRPME